MHVIDALVVTLGLDNKEYKKGIKDSEKVQDDFEKKTAAQQKKSVEQDKKLTRERDKQHRIETHQHKETIEGFKKMRDQLISFLLVFTAGKAIGSFIKDTISSSVAIGELSTISDTAISTVSGLQVVMKELGGSADDANAAVDNARQGIADFMNGVQNKNNVGLQIGASRAGVAVNRDAFNSTLSYMKAQADIVKGLWERNKKTAFANALEMGLTAKQFVAFKGGGAALERNIQRGAGIAGRSTGEIEAAERMQKTWTDIEEKLSRVGRSVLMPLLESVEKWLGNKENMAAFAKAFNELSTDFKKIDFTALGKGMEIFASLLIQAVDGVAKIVSLLTGKDVTSDATLALQQLFGAKNAPEWIKPLLSQILKPEIMAMGGNGGNTTNYITIQTKDNPRAIAEAVGKVTKPEGSRIGAFVRQSITGQN